MASGAGATVKDSKSLRGSLRALGLSGSAIDAAWPEWWSEAAEASTSAKTELRFSLSRKLGLDPKSLLNDEPRFVWMDEAKFKHLVGGSDGQRAAIASFGASIARALLAACPHEDHPSLARDPLTYRKAILARRPHVRLVDLIALCWSIGVPVAHLRVFPLSAKRMAAMVARVNKRFAILLGRDTSYPATISFYLAHELGHAALGHVQDKVGVVDVGDLLLRKDGDDEEELAADRFALELLTGMSEPVVLPSGPRFNAPALARAALDSAEQLHIEPGVLALCFGYSTGVWPVATSALGMIYREARPVWREVNAIALRQLDWAALNDDTAGFLKTVMGGDTGVTGRGR